MSVIEFVAYINMDNMDIDNNNRFSAISPKSQAPHFHLASDNKGVLPELDGLWKHSELENGP
jgi:hypothetical protein